MFRSFVMIKPDGVSRKLVGNVIIRFEQKGFNVAYLKMVLPTKELAEQHYEEHRGKPFYDRITDYISSGPVVAMVIEGPEQTIPLIRKMIGNKDPVTACLGTIRGDYALTKYQNIIHASDSDISAKKEIDLWFNKT
jgi:nucleoside-diphosphate kinase